MSERDKAFHAYMQEVTPNGNKRIDNVTLSLCGNQKQEQHIVTQMEMAFQNGWHAALDAVRKQDFE